MTIADLTKEQLENYAKESNSWRELMTKCGYTNFGCNTYLKKKLDIYDISVSHFKRTTNNKRYTNEEIFKENSEYKSMVCIKNKLIKQFGWRYECSSCKLSEWMNQKIPLEVDHINGIHTDNRIENLRFLCPNCHALTDTYKGKNIKNKEHSKEKHKILIKRKICNNCNNPKHKNSEYCHTCHIKIKLHKSTDKIFKECIDCHTLIQKESERCVECYKKARKNGNFEKQHINTQNMKKCPDCDKYISKRSLRCRLCHYALMKSKSDTNSKDITKGKCVDCKTNIEHRAVRCVPCSNKVIEDANNKLSKECIDCNNKIWNSAIRCVDCHRIHSRKVDRPSYNQLIEDKLTLNMVQIGKKYGVSDNTIRKWIKHYQESTI